MISKELQIPEPENYFEGIGTDLLPTPTQILFFLRKSKETLQQRALQNRSHHRTLLCCNLQTEGTVHLDQLALPLHPGEMLLILPYQFHHYSQLKSSRLKWLFCSFQMEPVGMLEPLRNRVLRPGEKTTSALGQLLSDWQAPQSPLQARQVQTSLMRLLLCLRQEEKSPPVHDDPASGSQLLRTVNRLLDEWRGRPVIVADLAGEIGYSESHLRMRFKEAVGIPLGTYIQNYRINRTMSLLRNRSLSIAQVAADAGFGSPQACSRMFKQATGQTPRAFRSGLSPQSP